MGEGPEREQCSLPAFQQTVLWGWEYLPLWQTPAVAHSQLWVSVSPSASHARLVCHLPAVFLRRLARKVRCLTSLVVLVDFFFNSWLSKFHAVWFFWSFWLFIDFRLVVILLLVVRRSEGSLPTSPSWPELIQTFLKPFCGALAFPRVGPECEVLWTYDSWKKKVLLINSIDQDCVCPGKTLPHTMQLSTDFLK